MCSSKIHVEILTPNVMVWGGRAFGRCWGHEGRALKNGINALLRRVVRVCSGFLSSTMWGYNERSAVCNLEEDSRHNLTVLAPWSWISSFQNCEKYTSVVYRPPSLQYFIIAAWTKTKGDQFVYSNKVFEILAFGFLFFINLCMYLLIFGCVGSSLLHTGFL